jgi:ABC-type amino acid transport substrate-binding protein
MNLNKLLKKRVDLVVCDKYVGLYTLKKELPNQVDALEFMSPPLEDKALYLCISKKAVNRDLKLKAFNDGLKKLKDSGKVDAIRKKNGF